jgi:SAM-dependent methyltransferase
MDNVKVLLPEGAPQGPENNNPYKTGLYRELNPSWHAEDSDWKARQVLRLLSANRLSPRTMAEVGCGAGGVIAAAARELRVDRAVGYDISADAIGIAKDREEKIVDYRQCDIREAGERYELLLVIDVFEHVEDYLGFLRSLRPLADHHIFHIPLDLSVQSVLRAKPLELVRSKVGHLHYFTKETALESLMHAGYRVDDWAYTPSGLELGEPGLLRQLASILRRVALLLNRDWAVRVLGGCSLLVLAHSSDVDSGGGPSS